MSSQISLKVGSVTATLDFGGTDAQVKSALTRFATSLGILINGTPAENLTAILVHIKDDVKRRSRAVQTAEKRVAADAAIAAEVEADHPL